MKKNRELMRLIVLSSLVSSLFIISQSMGAFNLQVRVVTHTQKNPQCCLVPTVISVDQTPINVEYYDSVNVTAVVVDAGSIASVELYYQVDAEDWQIVLMTNNSAEIYSGLVPPQAWNSFIRYYVNATDVAGSSSIDDNQGEYYGYSVVDSIKPWIRILSPHGNIIGVVTFSFEFGDAGSGFDRFEVYIDETQISKGTAESITFGQALDDGIYTIIVHAYDYAGNTHQEQVIISVTNPVTSPIPGFPHEAIGIALVFGLLGVGLLRYRRRLQH